MVIFMDTSSLLKHYVEEEGSDQVDWYFVDENIIWISPVTMLELNSALYRKYTDKSLDKDSFEKALNYWSTDQHSFHTVPFSTGLIEQALEVIKTHGIKTLDSVQVASAVYSNTKIWITSDHSMFKVMQTYPDSKSILI